MRYHFNSLMRSLAPCLHHLAQGQRLRPLGTGCSPSASGRCARPPLAPSERRRRGSRLFAEDKPDWLRSLEENAIDDPEVVEMLKEANKDPAAFEKKASIVHV